MAMMPPVEVPEIRSKWSTIRRPVVRSIVARTEAEKAPMSPPPSRLRIRNIASLPCPLEILIGPDNAIRGGVRHCHAWCPMIDAGGTRLQLAGPDVPEDDDPSDEHQASDGHQPSTSS